MRGGDALGTYRGKRRFDRTREPRGREEAPGESPRFVVQIHDAGSLHFDFRLEVDGVLKSWSVPKGPSSDPHDKRLAVPTEDHPLEYREFEGVIPAGEYGGGTVIVWDEGTYESLAHDRRGHAVPFAEALDHGHATFRLDGRKLRGEYALTRFRGEGDGSWLLVKAAKGDGPPGGGATPDPHRARSALSDRTLRQVAEDPGATWENGRAEDGRQGGRR